MDLILCHTTADFDTLGAAVGLTRLQPGSRIVLTGGSHPGVRDFLALHRDEYALIERRSVNLEKIRSLAIVDTQQRDRLGKAAEWLDLPQLEEITVIDHHLGIEGDIPATRKILEQVGSTTTLIVEQLQKFVGAGRPRPKGFPSPEPDGRGEETPPGESPTLLGAYPLHPVHQPLLSPILTPAEATVMALGIHADTGSLTFDHTTPRDVYALAWLMEQGASLQAIAEYVQPGLTDEVQELLPIALNQLQMETVDGQQISWVMLTTSAYVPGLSSLASRLLELTESDALLLGNRYLAKETGEERLTIIGRSRIRDTDLNELFKPLGGGGHPRAASASTRSYYPDATLAELIKQLKAQIPAPPVARELMSSPVRTIRPETTIDEAQRILLRYGHSGLSVVDATGQLLGVISRRDIDIALHHGFSHAPVKGYMSANLRTITPQTTLPEIESLMVTYDIGRLPVLDGGFLVGIVTRTDVLRELHQEARGKRQQTRGSQDLSPRASCVLPNLRDRLAPQLWQLLERAAEIASQRGWQLYLVGGAVRDLLLANPDEVLMLSDIDIVVDGDRQSESLESGAGVELAQSLRKLYPGARLEIHGQFQTAALLWHKDPTFESLWVDIATARTEFYPYPAANPEVEASSIRQDLYRRDFTINALAVRLTGGTRDGELLDFFGGLIDLQERRIRVLHANSFIEDPTRIYRAVRFAVRLGFEIDIVTEGYIRHAIASGIYERSLQETRRAPALETRLKTELKYILQAPYWKPAVQMLGNLGALRCIHPTLELDRSLWRQLRLVDRWLRKWEQSGEKDENFQNSPLTLHPSQFLLEVIIAHLDPEYRGLVATNLQMPAESIKRLEQLAAAKREVEEGLGRCDRPSQLVQLLRQYDVDILMLIAVKSLREVRRKIWEYLTRWVDAKPLLDGNDLKALGYKPGRHFKEMLDAVLAATVDGAIAHKTDAKRFLAEHFPRP